MRRPAALAYAPAKLARGQCASFVTQGDDDPGTLADDFDTHPLQASGVAWGRTVLAGWVEGADTWPLSEQTRLAGSLARLLAGWLARSLARALPPLG
jgi:hypothetical protein